MTLISIYVTPVQDNIPYFSRWVEYLTDTEIYAKDWRSVKQEDASFIGDLYNIPNILLDSVNIVNGEFYRFIIGQTREDILDFCMKDIQIPDTNFYNIIN